MLKFQDLEELVEDFYWGILGDLFWIHLCTASWSWFFPASVLAPKSAAPKLIQKIDGLDFNTNKPIKNATENWYDPNHPRKTPQ